MYRRMFLTAVLSMAALGMTSTLFAGGACKVAEKPACKCADCKDCAACKEGKCAECTKDCCKAKEGRPAA